MCSFEDLENPYSDVVFVTEDNEKFTHGFIITGKRCGNSGKWIR